MGSSDTIRIVDSEIEKLVRKLSAWEKVHETYAPASVEVFYSNYDSNYKKYIQEFIRITKADSLDNGDISTHVENKAEEHLKIVGELKTAFDYFKGIRAPNLNDLRTAVDTFMREVIDKGDKRFKDKILPIDNSRGGRNNNSILFGATADLFSGSGITTNNVTEYASKVRSEYERVLNSLKLYINGPASNVDFADKLGENFSLAVSNAVQNLSPAAYVSEIVPSSTSALQPIKEFINLVSGVVERLNEKSFDRFLTDMAVDASSGPDAVRTLLKDNFKLNSTADTYKNIAALDALYDNTIISGLDKLIDAAFGKIKSATKGLRKGPESIKKVESELKALEAALNQAKPGSHKSPNYSLVRGSRFLWADAKARLDAFTAQFSTANDDTALDDAIQAQGFLYRKPDKARLAYYKQVVDDFAKDVAFSANNVDGAGQGVRALIMSYDALCTRTKALIDSAKKSADELPGDDPAYKAHQLERIARQKQRIVENFLREAKRLVSRYTQIHVDFAIKVNRQAMRYMMYWKQMGIANGEARTLINEYEDALLYNAASVRAAGIDTLNYLTNQVNNVFTDKDTRGKIIEHMEDEQAERLLSKFQTFNEWANTCVARLGTVHQQPVSIFDIVTDSQVMLMYALKLLRYAFVIVALAIARRAFTSMYTEKVYESNADPPHPALMVLLFLGIEVSFAVATFVVLYFSKNLFYNGSGTFPVDGYLLSRWMLDYVIATVVLLVLALIFSDVVRKRKYFRYRYEGERGIRALEVLIRWTAGVILLLPFYRMAD